MIDIIYRESQKRIAVAIKNIIQNDGGYNSRLVLFSPDSFPGYVRKTDKRNCQLIISLEMNGFTSIDSDGTPFFNHLPINILVIMEGSPEIYDIILKMRLNYTIYFLHTSREGVKQIKEQHPHIYNVDFLPNLNSLPNFLNKMDWRYAYQD